MSRRTWKWTENQLDKLNKVIAILNNLEKYKPLTLRQIYYQMVAQEYIKNNKSQYGMLSGLLKYARIEGYISWDDIEDRVRVFHDLRGFDDNEQFVNQELDLFLNDYRRDLLQSQDKQIEIWIEKDALSTLFTRVARYFTVPVIVCRGFSSVSFLNDFKNRAMYYESLDRAVTMLYFGDFDPSGLEMLTSMKITLKEEMNVDNLEFKRIALLKEDIVEYSLPHNPDALKKSDTRAKKHIQAYGELAVELDALSPDILEKKARTAIENELDAELFNTEVELYHSELDKLNELKHRTEQFIENSR